MTSAGTARRPALLCVGALTLGFASCAHSIPVLPLPTWELAQSLRPHDVDTRTLCFDADVVDSSELPEAIPYAIARTAFAGDRARTAQRILDEIRTRTSPDFAVLHDLGTYDAGTVSQYWGHGLMTERRVYEQIAELVCWRLAPVSLDLEVRRKDGIVLRTPPRERFDGAELLEGDELLTIDEIPFRFGERWLYSPHWKHLLGLKVGDRVNLVWLRPGVGRMNGSLRVVANGSAWRQLPTLL